MLSNYFPPPHLLFKKRGVPMHISLLKAIEDAHTSWKSLFVVMHISHFKSSRWGTSLFWEGIGGVRYSTFSCWNRTCACSKVPIWSPLHSKITMCITYRFSKVWKLKFFKNQMVQALWIFQKLLVNSIAFCVKRLWTQQKGRYKNIEYRKLADHLET
jgi:hypothetical protein